MKKGYIRYIVVAVITGALLSCSDLKFGDAFLEKAPGTDVTIDTIFSSQVYADRALTAAYATLRGALIMHINDGSADYEFQNAGNRLGWDNLDALTDIIQTHCTWGGVYGMYYPGNYDAETEANSYSTKFGYDPEAEGMWSGIRRAYLYIDNVDRVPDMSDELKEIRKAEAKMIIASNMSEMLRHMGGVPILYDAVDAANQADVDFSRKTVQEVADFILGLCDEAADVLPWKLDDTDDGRFNKAAAMALKIRVLLLLASPIYNADEPYMEPTQPTSFNADKVKSEDVPLMTWLGGYKASRWQDVVDACEAFIKENEKNGNWYYLVDNGGNESVIAYRYGFAHCYADRANHEIFIGTCRQMRYFGDLYHRMYFGPSSDYGNTGRGYGGGCITLNYVDMFPNADGTKADYRTWIKEHNGLGTIDDNPFTGRDPRLCETVMIPGDSFQDRYAETWIDGREHDSESNPRYATGFALRKFLWDYTYATYHYKPANFPYLRLAEVYLAYAEALNEVGRKDEAMKWLDKTRIRVGLPAMTESLLQSLHEGETIPTYSECNLIGDPVLRQEIIDERAREFCFEEVRWFDIIRWKRDDIFQKTLYGIRIRIDSGSLDTEDLVLSFSDPVEEPTRYWKTNFSRKWYLSAFPSDEINKGYGLVQNPGW